MRENGISEICPYSLNQDYAEQWLGSLVVTAMLLFQYEHAHFKKEGKPHTTCFVLSVFSDIPMLGASMSCLC